MKILPVTVSYINDVMLCARLYYYTRVRNLRPPQMPVYMDQGTYLHALLETYYKGLMENYQGRDPAWTVEQLVEKAIEENRVKAMAPEMNLDPQDVSETEYQFREYVSHYKGDGLTPIAVEEPFSKLLFKDDELGVGVLVEGRIDLIGKPASHPDMQIVYDHKKTSRQKDPNVLMNQAFCYAWATGIRTFCLNEVGFQKTVPRNQRFKRHSWTYNPTQIQEWVGIATFWCKLVLGYIEDGVYPPNYTSCDKFGYVGGGGCRFREVCATIPDAREHKISQSFVEGPPHDPYVRD